MSFQKTSKQPEVEVDQTSASAFKSGPSKQAVTLDPPPPRSRPTSHSVEAMEVDYGPSLPQCLGADQSQLDNASDQLSGLSDEPTRVASARPKKHSHSHKKHDLEPRLALDHHSGQSDEPRVASSRPKKHADRSKHKVRSRYVSSSSEEDQSSAPRHRSSKPSKTHSDQDQPQHDPDPPYYREIAFSDVKYAEEVDIFRHILDLPDPRESMPRSSTSVMGLDDEKGRQELRPRGPSSMLPLSSVIKGPFDKFEHDFQVANLPEGKYIKPPPSTAEWYKVGQLCYDDKIRELNTDFAKICITPKPSPMGIVPLPILKKLEHQARQNISTLNFTAAFPKTSSS